MNEHIVEWISELCGRAVDVVTRGRKRSSRIAAWAATACVVGHGSPLSWAQSWNETKDELIKRGIAPSVIYDGDVFSNAAGGVRRGTTYVGNLHLQLTLDGERLINWPGMTVFLNGLGSHGGQPSAFSGDAQGVNNIAAPPDMKLYEAWLQYNFLDNHASILAGRYDLNAEFYRLQSAGLFLNSSFGVGPEFSQSGVVGPSIFPNTSLGVRFVYKPVQNIVLRTAILDSVPLDRPGGSVGAFKSGDGLLLVSEAAFLNRPAADDRPSNTRFRIGRGSGLPPYDDKLALGGWYYTGKFNDLSEVDAKGQPVQHRGSGGVYLLADRLLFQAQDDPKRRLSGFVEVGFGDARVDRFGSYVGSGLVATGLVPSRPSDELGLAVAVARNGSHFMDLQRQLGLSTNTPEVAIELTYLAQITKWLAVQPDLQYVIHPNTDPKIPNALAFQLRFEVAF